MICVRHMWFVTFLSATIAYLHLTAVQMRINSNLFTVSLRAVNYSSCQYSPPFRPSEYPHLVINRDGCNNNRNNRKADSTSARRKADDNNRRSMGPAWYHFSGLKRGAKILLEFSEQNPWRGEIPGDQYFRGHLDSRNSKVYIIL